MRVRRSRFVKISLRTSTAVDLARLLRGELAVTPSRTFVVLTLSRGELESRVSDLELVYLKQVALDEWTNVDDADEAFVIVRQLVDKGALLSDEPTEEAREALARECRLVKSGWHADSALFLASLSRAEEREGNRGALRPFDEIVENSRQNYGVYVEEHGPPPNAFVDHTEDAEAILSLDLSADTSAFGDLLARRRTVRRFDRARSAPLHDLATLLRWTFGVVATTEMAEGVTLLQRGCPSAGSLHPIEPYLMIRDVEDLIPGLYHYNAENHSLARLTTLAASAVEALAVDALSGQSFAKDAHALIVLVARFERSTWKYRTNPRVPIAISMDAGHLSQTFYLGSAELDLGCFYSAAIRSAPLARAFALEPFVTGPVGMLGCGPVDTHNDLGLKREPFRPRN